MKVADVKIVKAIKEFLSEIAPKRRESELSTEGTLKSKEQEKGSLNFNFVVPSDEFPDIFDEDDYLKIIKKMLKEHLKKDVRYLKINWLYADSDKGTCYIHFEVKLS